MPRLFTGIEIPDDIGAELAQLQRVLPGARWVKPADMHMTLRFVGDISPRNAADFIDRLDGIDPGVFEIHLSGFGVFGGNDPRQVWAGVEAGPKLAELAQAHDRAARQAGLPPSARPFKPHVTLARLQHVQPDLVAKYLERHAKYRSRPFLVSQFVLFSARPFTGGGPYATEDIFPLSLRGWPARSLG